MPTTVWFVDDGSILVENRNHTRRYFHYSDHSWRRLQTLVQQWTELSWAFSVAYRRMKSEVDHDRA